MAGANEQAIRHLYHVAEAATEDLEAFVLCYAEDGQFVDMSSGFSLRGRDEVWKTVTIFSKGFPSHTFERSIGWTSSGILSTWS